MRRYTGPGDVEVAVDGVVVVVLLSSAAVDADCIIALA